MFLVIRSRRLPAFALALVASLFVLALTAQPAAASPCGTRVLKDWSDNSRIDGTYQLHCYQDAIDALPQDLLDYSDAPDVIRRAFQDAGGRHIQISEKPQKQSPEVVPDNVANASSPSSLPIPLLVLAGVALALLAAGGFGYVARRRRLDE
jgi:hypothetical protein